MAKSKVNAQTRPSNILEIVDVDSITKAHTRRLEVQGLCLWASGAKAVVIPIAAYDAICAALGGVQ